jgi:hypothetical protein
MDTSTRKSIAARDEALARTGRVTNRIGAAALAGSLVLMAGFAHLLPTHLPHLNIGRNTGTGGNGGSGSGSNAPGIGSGSSHVTSGGS